MYDGFKQRAEEVLRLMHDAGTGFVVVTAPEGRSLEEAVHFVDRLAEARMHLLGRHLAQLHQRVVLRAGVQA